MADGNTPPKGASTPRLGDGIGGLQRAAVFLLSLGEKEAAEVLKHIGAKEVQKLGQAMASLGSVTSEQANQVIDSFVGELERQTSLGVGAEDYVRNVLVNALGEDKASGLIDRILLGRNTKGLEALKWMEPRSVADLVRNEHPQIIAIVLSHLDADQAAAVLLALPEPGGLRYVGRVGIGAADVDARTVLRVPATGTPPLGVPDGIGVDPRWLAPGLVAAVTGLITRHKANIVSLDQYSDNPEGGAFFQRVVFHRPDLTAAFEEIESDIAETLDTTEAAVKMQVKRAFEKLRGLLADGTAATLVLVVLAALAA